MFYEATASLEQDNGLVQGRDGIRRVLARHFAQWDPGFDGGIRRRVRMIGRIESGSIHAEWTERESPRRAPFASAAATAISSSTAATSTRSARWRTISRLTATNWPSPPNDAAAVPPYPQRPVVGVGAVIVHEGSVVLIKRKFEPLAGQWSLPGGTLELGESLEAGRRPRDA